MDSELVFEPFKHTALGKHSIIFVGLEYFHDICDQESLFLDLRCTALIWNHYKLFVWLFVENEVFLSGQSINSICIYLIMQDIIYMCILLFAYRRLWVCFKEYRDIKLIIDFIFLLDRTY